MIKKRWNATAGIFLIILGQILCFTFQQYPRYGISLIAIGVMLLIFAKAQFGQTEPNFPPRSSSFIRNRRVYGLLGIGLLIIFILGFMSISGTLLLVWNFLGISILAPSFSVWFLLSLWVVDIAFVFYVLVGGQTLRTWVDGCRRNMRTTWREWLLIALLFVFALVIRVIGVDAFPRVMHDDEGYLAYPAAQHYSPQTFSDYYLTLRRDELN